MLVKLPPPPPPRSPPALTRLHERVRALANLPKRTRQNSSVACRDGLTPRFRGRSDTRRQQRHFVVSRLEGDRQAAALVVLLLGQHHRLEGFRDHLTDVQKRPNDWHRLAATSAGAAGRKPVTGLGCAVHRCTTTIATREAQARRTAPRGHWVLEGSATICESGRLRSSDGVRGQSWILFKQKLVTRHRQGVSGSVTPAATASTAQPHLKTAVGKRCTPRSLKTYPIIHYIGCLSDHTIPKPVT